MSPNLPPLPQPGLILIPNFTAQLPESFLVQSQDLVSSNALISYADAHGKAGAPFLRLQEESKHNVVFRTTDGQEVMRIVYDRHTWSHYTDFTATRPSDGVEIWNLHLKTGWRSPKYDLTVLDKTFEGQTIEVESKVQGEDMGILLNGNPVSTLSRHTKWSHVAPHELVHVAPGMDILLAVGVAWIRAEKQREDAKVGALA